MMTCAMVEICSDLKRMDSFPDVPGKSSLELKSIDEFSATVSVLLGLESEIAEVKSSVHGFRSSEGAVVLFQ